MKRIGLLAVLVALATPAWADNKDVMTVFKNWLDWPLTTTETLLLATVVLIWLILVRLSGIASILRYKNDNRETNRLLREQNVYLSCIMQKRVSDEHDWQTAKEHAQEGHTAV